MCPALNSAVYNDSYLLVTVTKAILCIVAVAVACVFTVIFHLWLHWITAKRAHPFSPAKQESKKLLGNFFPNLVKQQISENTLWKASSLTSIMIAGNLKPIVLDILHWIWIQLEVFLFTALFLSQRKTTKLYLKSSTSKKHMQLPWFKSCFEKKNKEKQAENGS